MLKLISALTALTAGLFHLPAANIPASRYAGKLDSTPVKMPRKYPAPANEMRGVWVATIFNLDYPRPKNVQDYKKFFSNMCRNLANHNFNAIFFQVLSITIQPVVTFSFRHRRCSAGRRPQL